MGKPISFHAKWLGRFATATVATVATHEGQYTPTVASVATVTVTNPNTDKAVNDAKGPTVATVATVAVANPNTDKAVNDWKQADRAYQAHHVECPTCRAAGLGKGSMCAEGQALWDAYEAAPIPEFCKATTKRVAPPLPAPARQPPRFTPRSNAEIDRLVMLHQQAMRVGLPDSNDTDKALDAVMDAPLGMSACFACRHLRGASPDRWRCASTDSRNELSGAPLAREFVMHLHRCPAFTSA